MSHAVIERLRQNAVSLMSRDQSVKQLADIVAELCLVCEDQAKQIADLSRQVEVLEAGSTSETQLART